MPFGYNRQGWLPGYRPYFREWLHRYCELKCTRYIHIEREQRLNGVVKPKTEFDHSLCLTRSQRIKFKLWSLVEYELRDWVFPVCKWKPEFTKEEDKPVYGLSLLWVLAALFWALISCMFLIREEENSVVVVCLLIGTLTAACSVKRKQAGRSVTQV